MMVWGCVHSHAPMLGGIVHSCEAVLVGCSDVRPLSG